ncbi:MAG: carbohydrate-binding family 9-like protein [Gemmatimonadetes bacterium]|nr:carbohydrate-binding family 9-like protein [Gemmatimonadota bacterium]
MDEPDLWATITERDAVIFHDNDVELFVDPDGDGLRYFELEVNALNTAWDLFLLGPTVMAVGATTAGTLQDSARRWASREHSMTRAIAMVAGHWK